GFTSRVLEGRLPVRAPGEAPSEALAKEPGDAPSEVRREEPSEALNESALELVSFVPVWEVLQVAEVARPEPADARGVVVLGGTAQQRQWIEQVSGASARAIDISDTPSVAQLVERLRG